MSHSKINDTIRLKHLRTEYQKLATANRQLLVGMVATLQCRRTPIVDADGANARFIFTKEELDAAQKFIAGGEDAHGKFIGDVSLDADKDGNTLTYALNKLGAK